MTRRRPPHHGSVLRGLALGGVLAAGGLALLAGPAQAHPLGNFTTNQYAGLRVAPTGVDVDYVLDLAELPTYQAQHEDIDRDGDGTTSPAERDAYAARTCTAVGAATGITVAGRARPLTARPIGLTFRPGAGGLTTLRLQCVLHADARIGDDTVIGYRGTYLADRIGWREVTAVGDHSTLTRSSVPAASVSGRLTAYPTGTITSDVRVAEVTARQGGPAAAPIAGDNRAGAAAQPRGADRFTRWFTELVGHPELTWGIGLLAFAVALVLGGAHAVAPGHGKTIMAAYLVGARGRIAPALTVAAAVTVTHTVGVLALGFLLATSLQLAPDDLYDWLRLASGVLVALVGAQLLRGAIRHAKRTRAEAGPGHSHGDHAHAGHTHEDHAHAGHTHKDHAHAGHTHGDHGLARHAHGDHVHAGHSHEEHAHGGGRAHHHPLPSGDQPPRLRTLLAMGFAGGLSPSPSAVVVLLGAAALGRAWYGVLLVLAYGIGMAGTLTGIGLALARWGERLQTAGSGRWARMLQRRMPTATAATILVLGLGMATLAAVGLLTTHA